MPLELTVLTLAVILAMVQLILFAGPANRELGSDYLAGPRDEGRTIRNPMTGRLQRAFNNHIEGLAFFTPAVLVVVAAGKASWFTGLLAVIYLLARILYVPAYAYGWTPWRSLIWTVGFFATLAMLLAALLT